MKTAVALLCGSLLMTAAAMAIEPVPVYPFVHQVWLPEVPVLGPVRLAYQDPGHRLREQDPESFCWNPETAGSHASRNERDPHAHRCACHLICQTAPDGQVIGDREDGTCKHYCLREACTCHPEDPCEMPGAPQ